MRWNDYQNGIFAFDADYVRPLLSAVHLVVDQGEAALIDTGTNDSLPGTLEAIARVGLTPESVRYVILTHIHLDHAGGAGAMMQAFPNARLVVHPRGVRHMIDPSKLLAGVRAVYGDAQTAQLYGDLLPIAADRIIEATEGLRIPLGQRWFRFLDTPGHARHHVCIFDEASRAMFTGDMFGISYRELDANGEVFIFPTTSPSQFNPEEMHRSLDRIIGMQPSACYLTHYAKVGPVEALAQRLHQQVDDFCSMAQSVAGLGEGRHSALHAQLSEYLLKAVRAHGCTLPDSEILDILATDIELNSQGLEIWLDETQQH